MKTMTVLASAGAVMASTARAMHRNKQHGLTVAMALLLAACGQSLSGTYADDSGAIKLTFHGSNVEMSAAGTAHTLPYAISGHVLKVTLDPSSHTVMEFTIDGEKLESPLGTFTRQP